MMPRVRVQLWTDQGLYYWRVQRRRCFLWWTVQEGDATYQHAAMDAAMSAVRFLAVTRS